MTVPPDARRDASERSLSKSATGRRIDAVVIGASAGGVEALITVLSALPKSLGVPVLVVLHLPRHTPSALVEILTPKCAMAIVEAEDKTSIDAGTIYLAPPDYHVLIDKGPTVALSADEAVNYSRPSIDVLFESAADFYGSRLAGIILTGANADGARGMAAIEQAGGVTIVQDPETAYASAMPAATVKRIVPDHLLPLGEIAGCVKTLTAAADRLKE